MGGSCCESNKQTQKLIRKLRAALGPTATSNTTAKTSDLTTNTDHRLNVLQHLVMDTKENRRSWREAALSLLIKQVSNLGIKSLLLSANQWASEQDHQFINALANQTRNLLTIKVARQSKPVQEILTLQDLEAPQLLTLTEVSTPLIRSNQSVAHWPGGTHSEGVLENTKAIAQKGDNQDLDMLVSLLTIVYPNSLELFKSTPVPSTRIIHSNSLELFF